MKAGFGHLFAALGLAASSAAVPAEPAKIPLTIGFANFSGDDLRAIATEDAAALSPLFARARVVPDTQTPSAEILFIYAHLNEDGTIRGTSGAGLRQIAQVTKAAILVLASPNPGPGIQKAAALPGQKNAILVFTLDRNGKGFSRFFRELFEKMRDGKPLGQAWAELAPQHPAANQAYAPQTVLLMEGGNIAFPRPQSTKGN